MPELSNTNREYSINGFKYRVDDKITFKDDCVITYDQTHLDVMETRTNLVFSILDEICPNDYWVVSGTLLGAVRHGTVLPFDDDMDAGITIAGHHLILDKMDYIKQQYGMEFIEHQCGFKIYYDEDIVGDLFICDYLDETSMSYSGPYYKGKSYFYMKHYIFPGIEFKHTDIFPLRRLALGRIMINAPHNCEPVLINNYNDKCLNSIIPSKINGFHTLNVFNNKTTSKYSSSEQWYFYEYPLISKRVGWLSQSMLIGMNMSDFIDKRTINKMVDVYTDAFCDTDKLYEEIHNGGGYKGVLWIYGLLLANMMVYKGK